MPPWFSGVVAGGVCAMLLAFIIWRLFAYLIPEFLKTLATEREIFRQTLAEDRKEFRGDLHNERERHHADMEKLTRAIQDQNVLLVQLVHQGRDHQIPTLKSD